MLELLVVLIILLMVTAAAIPIMAPALDNRRMREAARMTSTFINGARSRAIQTGREVGVQLIRFNGQPYAIQMAYVEVPPPYGGDVTGATVTIQEDASPTDSVGPPIGTNLVNGTYLRLTFVAGSFNYNLVRVRDQIQLNYQGPRYTIIGPDADSDGVVDSSLGYIFAALWSTTTTTTQPWPWGAAPIDRIAYQIFRQPTRSSDTPMQLPEGVVIDLMYSGEGTAGYWGGGTINQPDQWQTNPPVPFDPIITFTPNGAVGHVGTTDLHRPGGIIYLLVGRRELVPDAATVKGSGNPPLNEDKNVFDSDPVNTEPDNAYLRNFWIAIGYQTGQVTTAEMAVSVNPAGGNEAACAQAARRFARTGQSVGGQ